MASKNGKRSSQKTKIQHKFVGIREVVLSSVSSKAQLPLTTNASGVLGTACALCPIGLTTAVLTSGAFNQPANLGNCDPPHLTWLYSQAINFDYYRITNLRLQIVGNVGSTTSGTLNVFTTRDMADLGAPLGLQTVFVGSSGRSVDVASLAVRPSTIPMVTDTSWKKVSSILNLPGNGAGFGTGTNTSLINVNSLNDLCFSGFIIQVVGGPANASIGTIQVIYDVEFRDPINVALND